MEEKFTVAEFLIYLQSVDSFGDAFYKLSAEKIKKAIQDKKEQDEDDVEENLGEWG